MTPSTIPERILQKLPANWQRTLARARAEPVTRGMSGASVWRLHAKPVRYLKIAQGKHTPSLGEEIARTAWLDAQGIRVSRIIAVHQVADLAAMVTEAVPGVPADEIDWPMERLLAALGRGLAQLHALSPLDCPFDETLAVRLARAEAAVAAGEVDPAQFDRRNRRTTPRALFTRLAAHPPRQNLVVAHGDASLSNLLMGPDGRVGFIDCGHAGRADRYLDLAIVATEVAERYGDDSVRILAAACGVRRWNPVKAAFYADLYEFF